MRNFFLSHRETYIPSLFDACFNLFISAITTNTNTNTNTNNNSNNHTNSKEHDNDNNTDHKQDSDDSDNDSSSSGDSDSDSGSSSNNDTVLVKRQNQFKNLRDRSYDKGFTYSVKRKYTPRKKLKQSSNSQSDTTDNITTNDDNTTDNNDNTEACAPQPDDTHTKPSFSSRRKHRKVTLNSQIISSTKSVILGSTNKRCWFPKA